MTPGDYFLPPLPEILLLAKGLFRGSEREQQLVQVGRSRRSSRKTADLKTIRVYANSHYVTPRPTLNQAVSQIKDELKERLEWLEEEPVPDVINLPNSLLIGLAAPLRRALKRPICCTLQGEDLFLNGQEGLYGYAHLSSGEEASAVGVISALGKEDYITSFHRGQRRCSNG